MELGLTVVETNGYERSDEPPNGSGHRGRISPTGRRGAGVAGFSGRFARAAGRRVQAGVAT
jgi:hypothetical protein